MIFLLGIN